MNFGKSSVISIALWCAATSSPTQGSDSFSSTEQPDGAEIVARCAQALGGVGAWQAVRTLEISGVQSSFSKERPFFLRRMRPDFYRLDTSEGVRPMTIAYDGENAWWQRELLVASRGNWELPAPAVYARAYRADASFDIPCVAGQEAGYEVTSLGRSELDGEPFFQLTVTFSDGAVENWYLDTDSFLPIARVATGAYWRMPMEERTFFSDFREIGGIMLPHHLEIETGNLFRTMDIEDVKVNGEIDPGIFSMPLPGDMTALQGLVGRWQVKTRSRENAQSPWEESEGISVISADFDGSLIEENLSYVASTAFPLSLRRTFSYDRFRQTFRVAVFDNFTSHLNVLEGELKDGQLIVSNQSTETPWSVYGKTYHSREHIFEMTADSFSVKREISADAGVTWVVEEELSYSRARD